MKPMLTFIFCLSFLALACGTQLPTAPSYNGENPSHDVSLPVAASQEPTESAPVYVTTAPLNVRAEANADSTILGTIPSGETITIFVLDILGDDCYGGEWYAMEYRKLAGYVCSLYVKEIQ